MAEMEVKDGGDGKQKKLSTRVDLTPMVDLGFLLITFFMFTTTMSSPTAMDLFMPKDTERKDEQTKVKESGVFSILIGDEDKVYFYEGQLKKLEDLKQASFKSIRADLLKKKENTDTTDFVVIIKPAKTASYKAVVDILDEMTINEVKRYALVDITEEELEYVNLKKKQVAE